MNGKSEAHWLRWQNTIGSSFELAETCLLHWKWPMNYLKWKSLLFYTLCQRLFLLYKLKPPLWNAFQNESPIFEFSTGAVNSEHGFPFGFSVPLYFELRFRCIHFQPRRFMSVSCSTGTHLMENAYVNKATGINNRLRRSKVKLSFSFTVAPFVPCQQIVHKWKWCSK